MYKSQILNEFCELTGHDRKHAIKLMAGRTGIRKRPPGRKKTYGKEVSGYLRAIWKWADYPCSKLLAAMLAEWLKYYEEKFGRCQQNVHQSCFRLVRPRLIGS
jgi:hypothetical protein